MILVGLDNSHRDSNSHHRFLAVHAVTAISGAS